jgi:hypothetical protein
MRARCGIESATTDEIPVTGEDGEPLEPDPTGEVSELVVPDEGRRAAVLSSAGVC